MHSPPQAPRWQGFGSSHWDTRRRGAARPLCPRSESGKKAEIDGKRFPNTWKLCRRRRARIADIGAALGYFTRRLSQAVGARVRVFAVDVDARSVAFLKARAAEEKWTNVEIVHGREADPLLPGQSLDAALIVVSYHQMTQPKPMLRRLQEALKPGARLVISEDAASKTLGGELMGLPMVSAEFHYFHRHK